MENNKKECKFCKETNCITSHTITPIGKDSKVKEITSLVRLDIRPEDDLFQIDVQTLYKNNEGKYIGEFSDDCLDINFCPMCGRSLREENRVDSEAEKVKKIIQETKESIGKAYEKQEVATRNLIKKMFWGNNDDADLAEKLNEVREETGKELKDIQQIFVSKMKKAAKSEKVFNKAFDEILLYAGAKFLDKEMRLQEEKEKNYDYTNNRVD